MTAPGEGTVADGERTTSASTRARLERAALEVLADRGYDGTRIADIARRAGLTTGAIYSNYRTKADLIASAIVAQHSTLFRSALADQTGPTLGSAVFQALTQPAAPEHRSLLDVMAAALHDDAVHALVVDMIGRRNQVVTGLVEAARSDRSVGSDISTDALSYVVQLLGLGGVVSQALGLPAPDPAELRALLDRLESAVQSATDVETSGG